MAEILDSEELRRVDTYDYHIQGSEKIVQITFVDGRFDGVLFPFGGKYTRENWFTLRAIAEKISVLENRYDPARIVEVK